MVFLCLQVLSSMVGLHIPQEKVSFCLVCVCVCVCVYLHACMCLNFHMKLGRLFLLQLNSIVHRTMTEADKDKDSFIDFEEFKKVLTYLIQSLILLLDNDHINKNIKKIFKM